MLLGERGVAAPVSVRSRKSGRESRRSRGGTGARGASPARSLPGDRRSTAATGELKEGSNHPAPRRVCQVSATYRILGACRDPVNSPSLSSARPPPEFSKSTAHPPRIGQRPNRQDFEQRSPDLVASPERPRETFTRREKTLFPNPMVGKALEHRSGEKCFQGRFGPAFANKGDKAVRLALAMGEVVQGRADGFFSCRKIPFAMPETSVTLEECRTLRTVPRPAATQGGPRRAAHGQPLRAARIEGTFDLEHHHPGNQFAPGPPP